MTEAQRDYIDDLARRGGQTDADVEELLYACTSRTLSWPNDADKLDQEEIGYLIECLRPLT